MIRSRRVGRAVLRGTTATATLVAAFMASAAIGAPAASAHPTRYTWQRDTAAISSNHTTRTICDRSGDGYSANLVVITDEGTVDATLAPPSACRSVTLPTEPVDRYRICKFDPATRTNVQCSPWQVA